TRSSSRPSTSSRSAVVRLIVKAAANRFQNEKDEATLGTLGFLLTGYLLGVEKECYEASRFIFEATSGLSRRTGIEPMEDDPELRSKRARETAAIFACMILFNELENEEMNEMLSLLGSWEGAESADELCAAVTPFVVNAAREPSAWQYLERELPESCRLIELYELGDHDDAES
ncbi:MAG TPA: hypothetical protein VLV54_12215, partial [Thermoanaerobaculia bacterium]|nr:hypothetical protein [Thermoanaerobaculia bacterium]